MNSSGRSFGSLNTTANIQNPPAARTQRPQYVFSRDENTVPNDIAFNNLSSNERMRVLLDAASQELSQMPAPIYRTAGRN